jgi:hypothetical protein
MRRSSIISLAIVSTFLVLLPNVGIVSAAEAPGACKDVGIAGFWDSITISGEFPDNYEASDLKGFHFYRGMDPTNLTLHYTMNLRVIPLFKMFMYQDTEILNGVKYYYSVAAFNSEGDGPSSEVLSAICLGAPSAPQNLTWSATCTSVTLSWSEPLSDGGEPIVNYSVFRDCMNEGAVLIGNTTSLTFTDPDVGPEFYVYQVCAVNEYGPGKKSTVDFIVPMPRIVGTLVYSDGAPLTGATVELDGNVTVATTDENGRFTVEAPFGSHLLRAWVDGRMVLEQMVSSSSDVHDVGSIAVERASDGDPKGADLTMLVVAGVAVGAIILAGAFLVMRRRR